ncbi:carotenoid 1,2-hydratase [Vibrio aquaticus]|uniref:Carotenoid 1,2-hydratase n=1 Tax=Vibrio aquaticus TaxID=2496559 RepID=A0A3S0MPL1_9VIBR|nr:lipocalin-like domain-containing protein [Vibrio aquaticus]RTZ16740.1 carotenoid 1,2-hydratase [Vibrio aquaticus]
MDRKIKRVVSTAFMVILLLVVSGALYLYSSVFGGWNTNHTPTSQVLRTSKDQVFEPVLPDNPVVLPRDFSFQDEFQHGWWHFFANVKDSKGKRYGVQWSYFRVAINDSNLSGWLNPQLYVSHIVISSDEGVWREQRVARGGIGQAGMTVKPFRLWIDNWYWRSLGKTPFPGQLDVATDTFSVNLKSITRGPFVIPGDKGYVSKHDLLPIASHNMTAPFLSVRGELKMGDEERISVEGQGWMSKEWGSGLLAQEQQGWDWFVIHLGDETTLSVSRYRHEHQLPYVFGTLATNDGKVIPLSQEQLTLRELGEVQLKNGKTIPDRWSIRVPDYGINLTTSAVHKEQWLPFIIPYWEGEVKTQGSHEARGFMQLTGY